MNNKLSLIIKIILVLTGIAVAYFVLKYPLNLVDDNGSLEDPTTIINPEPNNPAPSQNPDYPLTSVPTSAISVKYLIEHRSALNGKIVKVKGVVVADWTDASRCPPNAELDCPQAVIVIADNSAELYSDMQLRVLLNDGDKSYHLVQSVEITGMVEGSKESVMLIKTY